MARFSLETSQVERYWWFLGIFFCFDGCNSRGLALAIRLDAKRIRIILERGRNAIERVLPAIDRGACTDFPVFFRHVMKNFIISLADFLQRRPLHAANREYLESFPCFFHCAGQCCREIESKQDIDEVAGISSFDARAIQRWFQLDPCLLELVHRERGKFHATGLGKNRLKLAFGFGTCKS